MTFEQMFRVTLAALFSLNLLGAPAVAATPGPACQALKEKCLAHAAFSRKVALATKLANDAVNSDDQACYNAFDAAEKTGIWPSFGVRPKIPCAP